MARRMTRLAAAMGVAMLVAASCGGSGDETTGDATTTTTAGSTEDPTSTSTTGALPTTAPPTTTTTEPPLTGPTPLPLEDIPDLVVAWGDGTDDPLELAQQINGFPLAIPTPGNTTPLHLSLDMRGGDPESPWEWEWTYEVLTSDPMPDIDIHADEPSPGNVALREFYDPVMADLGFTYSNSTGSDPGDEGGPNSINHVYKSDEPTRLVNGLAATPGPIFVWADEEQVFGEGVPGYQVDASFDFDPGAIPVPLVQTMLDELPDIPGAQLVDVGLRSWIRPESSFDADRGLRYFDVTIEWVLPPESAEEAKATFSTGLGPSAFFAGEESFFDPGFVEAVEPRVSGDDWTQPIVFVDRYEGSVDLAGDDAEGVTLEVDVRFEPNRAVLQELPD